ncbi:hypothetical protein [Roseibium sp.]|uniref:hypothetical protein n=1 Tax=Roseibium sp. TaxID=1936156 RepID=UPI0039EF116D
MRINRTKNPPARRVHKRGQRKKAHYVALGGVRDLSQLESRLEASAAIVMGLDPRIRAMRSQPICFDVTTGRTYALKEELRQATAGHAVKPVAYTPDFEIGLGKGPAFVEVKHSKLIALLPEFVEYPDILARFGHRLLLLDEEDLPEELHRNARLLQIALRQPVPEADLHAVASSCIEPTSFTALKAKGHSERTILVAIGTGVLSCDLRYHRLSGDTVVSVTTGAPTHLMELPFD